MRLLVILYFSQTLNCLVIAFGREKVRCVSIAGSETAYWYNTYHINYALNKTASQSSNHEDSSIASKAIDGNIEQMWIPTTSYNDNDLNSIAQTNKESTPFWEVDLGEDIHVHYIVIYQRLNFNPLKKFDVIAYDSQDNKVKRISMEDYGTGVLRVNFSIEEQIIAKKIRIQMSDMGFDRALSLAEVEVYGIPKKFISSNDYHTVTVDIGKLFTSKSQIGYVSFIQDVDRKDGPDIQSKFKNLRVYDVFPPKISVSYLGGVEGSFST